MTKLVVGLGNPYRGDDAAGLVAVRQVRTGRRIERTDCVDLLDLIGDEDEVVIIDAMRSGRPVGSVVCFEASEEALPNRSFVSSHAFGLAETLELARALNRLPASLTVFGIEVSEPSIGESVSGEVEAAAQAVASAIDGGGV